MKKRIILYKKGFRYELALEEGKTATVSNQETAQLTPGFARTSPSFPMESRGSLLPIWGRQGRARK